MAIIEDFLKEAEDRYKDRDQIRNKNLQQIKNARKKHDISTADKSEKIQYRRSLIKKRNDTFAWERVIGKDDLLSINYLEFGKKASRTICRIKIKDLKRGELLGYGTGFMVSQMLLMTNWHVLKNQELGKRSLAEFNFENDMNFETKDSEKFSLESDRFFYTNKALDLTLVAVSPVTDDGVSLKKFGHLKLLEKSGKDLLGEHVTIIQHPNKKTDFCFQ